LLIGRPDLVVWPGGQFPDHVGRRATTHEILEDAPDQAGLDFIDHQQSVLHVVPHRHREWAVGVISTVVTGIGGGAIAVQYFGLQEWVESVTGLVALGGLIFGSGLPGWAIVRWFLTSSRRTGVRGSMRSRRK